MSRNISLPDGVRQCSDLGAPIAVRSSNSANLSKSRDAVDRKTVRLFRAAMNSKAKAFVMVLLVALASAAHSELVWEQTGLELHPAVDDQTAVGHFKYQNKGDKTIAIKSVTTSCGCTAASAKQSAEPGEKGEITATFTIGNRVGVQQKMITVTTDDPAHPSTALQLKVDIPQVLDLQSAFVYWQAGEAAKPKTITAKAGKDVTIKNLDVSSSDPNFVTKVEQGSSAGEFRINVEPRQTTQAATATLTIKPNLPSDKSKIFYATARVMAQSLAGAQQPANAVAPAQPNPPGKVVATAIAGSNKSKIDACALLTSKEIESVQAEPLKETKPSGQFVAGLAVSQCYFALPTSSNSISLTVTQRGDGADARDPQQFWKETFHSEKDRDKARNDEQEKAAHPQKIDGLGDEAFWIGNRVGGALYALKGNSYVRISVGGAGDQAAKIDKSKKLAQMVLKRL